MRLQATGSAKSSCRSLSKMSSPLNRRCKAPLRPTRTSLTKAGRGLALAQGAYEGILDVGLLKRAAPQFPVLPLNLLFHELRNEGVQVRRRVHRVRKHEGLTGSLADISLRRTEQRLTEYRWIVQVQVGRLDDLSR